MDTMITWDTVLPQYPVRLNFTKSYVSPLHYNLAYERLSTWRAGTEAALEQWGICGAVGSKLTDERGTITLHIAVHLASNADLAMFNIAYPDHKYETVCVQ